MTTPATIIDGDVHTQGGDFVSRDKIVQHIKYIINQAQSRSREAEQDQQIETKHLADGVARYLQILRDRANQAAQSRLREPYKGLDVYRLTDAERFYGRTQAIRELARCLNQGPLTVLHGESGSGKTSLLRAGIEPLLLLNGHLPIYLRPYDQTPSAEIKEAFISDLELVPMLKGTSLRHFLRQVNAVLETEASRCYVFIILDQFEEFFTRQDEQARDKFITELAECLNDETLNVRWVVCVRKEHFGDLREMRPRVDPFQNEYLLNRLTRAEAIEAATKPLEPYRISFEDGLIDLILNDLGQNEIAPAQLQLVCTALWQSFSEKEITPKTDRQTGIPPSNREITRRMYTELGGAPEILKGYLARVLREQVSSGLRGPARSLIEALVTSGGRRNLRTRTQLEAELHPYQLSEDQFQSLLEQLVDSRLLQTAEPRAEGRSTEEDNEPHYELVHDYLAEQVQLSPEVRGRKQAQELLERELLSWHGVGALMRSETLQAVTNYRQSLQIDEQAAELLTRSALETGENLAEWLSAIPPGLARRILLEGLERERAELRAQAARALKDYLDAEVVAKLFERAIYDEAEQVCEAALATLAGQEAQAYREDWQPLWRGLSGRADDRARPSLQRKAFVCEQLRLLGVRVPPALRMQAAPLRLWVALRRRLRERPVWTLTWLALPLLVYLGLAWCLNWVPFHYWQPLSGAPQVELSVLASNGEAALYLGSFHYGVKVWENSAWTPWLRDDLPTVGPGIPSDPESNIPAIDAISPSNSDLAYALVRKQGLFVTENRGQLWQAVGGEGLPEISGESQPGLAVHDNIAVVAAGTQGLYGMRLVEQPAAGNRWEKLNGANGPSGNEFNTVNFTDDSLYAGGEAGLFRASGEFPNWQWEHVLKGISVFHMEVSNTGVFFLALTGETDQAACWDGDPAGNPRVIKDFGLNFITALTAHPTDPETFYVGTLFGTIYELHCQGKGRYLGNPGLLRGVSDMDILYPFGEARLYLLNLRGIYWRSLP